jgi:predicted enzyme related to lactoylglutathione lyase
MEQPDAPGQAAFSWVELVTSDWSEVKPFYEKVFGWTAFDSTTPAGTYVTFQQDHADVAGLYEMAEEQREGDTPPHWLPYVSVPSVHEALSQAGDLGALLVNSPTDLGSAGRAAVIEDPTGAVLALWEAQEHPGMGLVGEPVSLAWAEHLSARPADAVSFYTRLFDWAVEHVSSGDRLHSYLQGRAGDVAGVAAHEDDKSRGQWRVYFSVVEAERTLDQIKNHGGAVEKELEGPQGPAAHAADPQGASFGILEREVERKKNAP